MTQQQRWGLYSAIALLPGLGFLIAYPTLAPSAVLAQVSLALLVITGSVALTIFGWWAFAQGKKNWELAALIPLTLWTSVATLLILLMSWHANKFAGRMHYQQDLPKHHSEVYV